MVDALDQHQLLLSCDIGRLDSGLVTRTSTAGIAAGLVPFLVVLWNLGLSPLRTADSSGAFSNFYDVQARALLHGHLDVPPGSLGIEEFVVGGRSFMYFPPFPALLRMPVLLVTSTLDGRLTALSMLIGTVVFAVATATLVWTVRGRIVGSAPVTRFEAFLAAVLIASATGGSTMLYLAAEPFVYHEAYVWSAALTMSTIVVLLRFCDRPSTGRAVWVCALATATILTRATAGWAVALTVLAIAVRIRLGRPGQRSSRASLQLASAGAVALSVGAWCNWVKFRHPFRFPINAQVWSQISPVRQAALAANSGRLDGPQFVWSTVATYFRPDGVRFVPRLPFVEFPAHPPGPVGSVVLDQTYRTGSISAFMPLLLIGATWGFIVAFRRHGGSRLAPLRIVLVGCLAMSIGVVAFSYIAFRYTAEFLPVLVTGSTIALVDAGRHHRVAAWPRRRLVFVCVLAGYGCFANIAVGLTAASVASRGDRLERFIEARAAIGNLIGQPDFGSVVRADEIPGTSVADQLLILGDCAALLFGTGETSGGWVPVEVRGVGIVVEPQRTGVVVPSETTLVTFDGATPRTLGLQRSASDRFRFRVRADGFIADGEWFDVEGREAIRVDVTADTGAGRFDITTNVGFLTSQVLIDPGGEGDPRVVRLVVAGEDSVPSTRAGLTITSIAAQAPDLCRRISRAHD